ncbi:MAG: hypothetical protein ACK4NF_00315 [Planctomycetota bacterium]
MIDLPNLTKDIMFTQNFVEIINGRCKLVILATDYRVSLIVSE